ncbi:YbaB/EbfC family nucleoid-associated protein [Nocardia beijingensis]|uniref:YbaB/EbfC family nucleoid-associated protein n=1 Tax=Nocardia beijingensis TaxID=95162 RepID=UPI003320C579
MAEEIDEALIADMLEGVGANITAIRRFIQERARLTAEGFAANKRVTVLVDADGHIVETRLAPDYDELSRSELAAAITAAAQQATAEIQRRTAELTAPIRKRHERVPKISELFPGMPDLAEMLSTHRASAAAAGDHEQSDAARGPAEPVEAERESVARLSRPEIIDRSW